MRRQIRNTAAYLLACSLFLMVTCGCSSGIKLGNFRETRGPLVLSKNTEIWKIDTLGGAGGRRIEVTNLNREGPGSIGAALRAKGPRTVVFRVGGVIDLDAKELRVTQPFLTLDGGSAPEPGITFIRGGLTVSTHDVIVRHIRIRVGEAGFAKRSGWEMDGISLARAQNVIIENCSITWATDENLAVSGPRFEGETPEDWSANTSHSILLRNNIIAEGLNHSTHTERSHSKGILIHDNVSKVAIIGNLLASNTDRNPITKGGSRTLIANNLIHNPGNLAIHYALVGKEWADRPTIPGIINVIGNVIQFGPDTTLIMPKGFFLGRSELFTHDNRVTRPNAANIALPWMGQFTSLNAPPFWLEGFEAKPSSETINYVLNSAGARPWSRDIVDTRIIEEARNRRGKIIDSEQDVEGYPPYP